MGCFLGCFGGEKTQRRRKHRAHRGSPQRQRNRIQNVKQENTVTAEQSVAETTPANLILEVLELRDKPEVVEEEVRPSPSPSPSPSPTHSSSLKQSPGPSPRKRVTFNSNVTTYEHVPVLESIESLPDCAAIEEEKQEDSKSSSRSLSPVKDDDSVASSVASYPPNHRYHNARESDDEAEEYGDSDLEDLDDEDDDEYDYYSDEEDTNARFPGHKVWSESVVTASMESRTGSSSPPATRQEVESSMVKTQLPGEEVKELGSKTNARDRSDYINSVLNPVENISQWKAVKSKGTALLKPQKENFANFEAPRMSFSSEPIFGQAPSSFKAKSHQSRNANQEIAVDASLSNWLGSAEVAPSKKTSFSGFETITKSPQSTMSEGCISPMSFEDRPILGALTVDELRQISASPSPRKSPSRSPDEMPIIGSVGTYWNDLGSAKQHPGSAVSFKGIPNTTSKYREDKKVNWHSTPFETRLDRALNRGAA